MQTRVLGKQVEKIETETVNLWRRFGADQQIKPESGDQDGGRTAESDRSTAKVRSDAALRASDRMWITWSDRTQEEEMSL